VHVVVANILTDAAEVAAAACGERGAQKDHGNKRRKAWTSLPCWRHWSRSGFDGIKAGLQAF
jgi:hypothetical protein